jgi:hypothetical protein
MPLAYKDGRVADRRNQMKRMAIALGVSLAITGPACAGDEALPWRHFSEIRDAVVSADEVACPASPTESVLRMTLRYEGNRYAYMAKELRWVMWRLQEQDLPNGEVLPTHVWFGDQPSSSEDAMHVVLEMPYEDAELRFKGPCAWLELGQSI